MADWLERHEWIPGHSGRMRRKRQEQQTRTIRYGAGVALGILAVHYTKKAIRRIPVVGFVASPFLDLFPSLVVGSAVGAGVVFVLEEGDIKTATHKAKKHIRQASNELETAARDLSAELQYAARRQSAAAQGLVPALEANLRDLQDSVTPVLDREYRTMEDKLARYQAEQAFQRQLQAAAAAGRG